MNQNDRSLEPLAAPQRALVTGGSGLLGGNIVRRLLAEGTEVVALVRDTTRAERLLPADDNLRIVAGDVTAVDSYRPHLSGVEAVFHTAAYFREYYQPGADQVRLERTNVAAVQELLEVATQAKVPVVVHTSSSTTLARGVADLPADEETPPPPNMERNAYRASKVRSEQVVQRFIEHQTDLRVPIILPAWIWGPGDPGEPGSSGGLFLAIARRTLRVLPQSIRHVVDARDVAEGAVRAAAVGQSGRRYIVGGNRHRLSEVFATVADAVGVSRPRSVPAPLAMVVVGMMEAAAKLSDRRPVATRNGARIITETENISSARAERELGISFRSLRDTMDDEARWFEEIGLLERPPALKAHRSESSQLTEKASRL